MSSEASVAIEGAKQLLATAKKWDESASKTLEAAKKEKASSQTAVEKAKEHLKEMEKKYEVVNLLDESQVIDVDSTDDDSQLFVKTLAGKTISIAVDLSGTVERVKEIVQLREGIPPDNQTLYQVRVYRITVPYLTTTSKRNQLFISECKSSLRHCRVRPSPLMSSLRIPSTTLRLRFRTRRESPLINSV